MWNYEFPSLGTFELGVSGDTKTVMKTIVPEFEIRWLESKVIREICENSKCVLVTSDWCVPFAKCILLDFYAQFERIRTIAINNTNNAKKTEEKRTRRILMVCA